MRRSTGKPVGKCAVKRDFGVNHKQNAQVGCCSPKSSPEVQIIELLDAGFGQNFTLFIEKACIRHFFHRNKFERSPWGDRLKSDYDQKVGGSNPSWCTLKMNRL